MKKEHKNRRTEASDFRDYFGDRLTERDRNAFERLLQQDPFEAEAAEGYEKVSAGEAQEDLGYAADRIRRHIQRNRRNTWMGIAAALVSALIVTTIFINVDKETDKSSNTIPAYDKIEEERMAAPEKEEAEKSDLAIPMSETISPADQEIQTAGNTQIPEKSERKKEAGISDKGTGKEEYLSPENEEIIAEELQPVESEMEVFQLDEYHVQEQPVSYSPEKKRSEPELTPVNLGNQSRAEAAPAEIADDEVRIEAVSTEKALTGTISGVKIDTSPEGFIHGNIMSADNLKPLPGVNIMVRGTKTATITDMDGNFTIAASEAEGKTLVASYIGMETEEFTAVANEPVEIAMMPDNVSLDEVVVVGYGTGQRNEEATDAQALPYAVPEYISAMPVDGFNAYREYIAENLVYPDVPDPGKKVVVVLKLYITSEGRPYNITVIRSPGQAYSDEAIRLILNGPDWFPAEYDGEYMDESLRMRVVFDSPPAPIPE